jgi:hypothetical protein
MLLLFLVRLYAGSRCAQDLAGIEIHGFVTQGFLVQLPQQLSDMQSSSGGLQWTDGAVRFTDSLTASPRAGIQLHMYSRGQLCGPSIRVDWASGDYKVDHDFGVDFYAKPGRDRLCEQGSVKCLAVAR